MERASQPNKRFRTEPATNHTARIIFIASAVSLALLLYINYIDKIMARFSITVVILFSSLFALFIVACVCASLAHRFYSDYNKHHKELKEGLHESITHCARAANFSHALQAEEDLWHSYNIFSLGEVLKLENDASVHEKSIWILTSYFDMENDSTSQTHQIMRANINSGTEYVYFISKYFAQYKAQLNKAFGDGKIICCNLSPQARKNYDLLVFDKYDVIIFNPAGATRQAYLCIHFYHGEQRYRKLPDDELLQLIDTLRPIRETRAES